MSTTRRETVLSAINVEFFRVYMRQVHPADGWQGDANFEEGILFGQRRSANMSSANKGRLSTRRGQTPPLGLGLRETAIITAIS